MFGPNSGRSWQLQVSDAWFYLRHPVLFYREVWCQWQAQKKGQAVWEL